MYIYVYTNKIINNVLPFRNFFPCPPVVYDFKWDKQIKKPES
jgi:hypothetical protein